MSLDIIRDDLLINDTRPYVLWRRVSTDKQGESGLGLDAQYTLAVTFTRREPERVFTDVYSGTKLKECKELWNAIEFCKSNNYLLLVTKTDRFRNVKEALEVIDSIGERNIAFCDMPHVDRMILTIMFSVWERQAIMGRINTSLALQERLKQARENGGWISKSGQWRTGMGGIRYMTPEVIQKTQRKAADGVTRKCKEWTESSIGIKWVKVQLAKGVPRKDIIKEFNMYHDMGMEGFSTRTGKPLSKGLLSIWIKRILHEQAVCESSNNREENR